ncbi:MAG: hypothetical protein HFJ04_02535 [Lachnospiraceae bacterium]|nr:hypothetical protein [Lachnospiraceae bacterium]
MSNLSDAAGAEDDKQKGKAPKEHISCGYSLGHILNKYMTVIFQQKNGALS